MFAPVLQVEAAARAARLEWALAANLNEIALPGVFFALDRTSDSLFLCYRIAAHELDAEQLTFHSEQPLPKNQVLQIVRDILAKNGLILKQISGVYHVGSHEVISSLESTASEGRANELITQVIRLKKGDPAKLIAVIRQIVPAEVALIPTPGSTSLLVRGSRSRWRRSRSCSTPLPTRASVQVASPSSRSSRARRRKWLSS